MSTAIIYKDSAGKKLQFKTKKEFILYKEGLDKVKPSILQRKPNEIKYPSSLSEFEIQAYLYSSLQKLKFDIRGEVTSKTKAGEGCKFDLVIYRNKKAIRINEQDN